MYSGCPVEFQVFFDEDMLLPPGCGINVGVASLFARWFPPVLMRADELRARVRHSTAREPRSGCRKPLIAVPHGDRIWLVDGDVRLREAPGEEQLPVYLLPGTDLPQLLTTEDEQEAHDFQEAVLLSVEQEGGQHNVWWLKGVRDQDELVKYLHGLFHDGLGAQALTIPRLRRMVRDLRDPEDGNSLRLPLQGSASSMTLMVYPRDRLLSRTLH